MPGSLVPVIATLGIIGYRLPVGSSQSLLQNQSHARIETRCHR